MENEIQGPRGDGRDRMCGGGSVSNRGPRPSNRGNDGAGSDCLGSASRGRGTPHVHSALSDESSEKRGRPVKRMIFCPPARRAGSAGHRRQSIFLDQGEQGLECIWESVDETDPPR